jgi:hypothetical protein
MHKRHLELCERERRHEAAQIAFVKYATACARTLQSIALQRLENHHGHGNSYA